MTARNYLDRDADPKVISLHSPHTIQTYKTYHRVKKFQAHNLPS